MSIQARAARQAHLRRCHDSAAHLLAEAMQEFFPDVQLANTYVNSEGFSSDFALERALAASDLAALEQHIASMIARNLPCTRAYWSRPRLLAYFRQHSQSHKIVQLADVPTDNNAPRPLYAASSPQLCGVYTHEMWPDDLLVYQHGSFVDLCNHPHVEHAGEIGTCRLVRVEYTHEYAESGIRLQRIYGQVEP